MLPNDPTEGAEEFEDAGVAPRLPGLVVSKEGRPLNRRKNLRVVLEHHPRWKRRLWFDCFGVCYRLGDNVVDDAMINTIMVDTGEVLGVQFTKRTTEEAVVYVGRQRSRHPLAEWLQSLVWDGEPRLDKLLPRYLGTADDDLHQRIGAWWMMQAAARPLNPGCQADYTLVLIGNQGVTKSSAVRALATRAEWFHDTKIKLGEKDALQALQGCWIMELAELSSLRGTDVETIKAFLTSREDRFRPPYGKGHETFPRSTVFLGTGNKVGFLTDPTGGRRFWPVKVGTIDLDALKGDIEQLWAEAVRRVRAKERRWPNPAEEAELDRHRALFEVDDAHLGPIQLWLTNRSQPEEPFTIDQVMSRALDLAPAVHQKHAHDVADVLRKCGCERHRRRHNGAGKRWLWFPPGK